MTTDPQSRPFEPSPPHGGHHDVGAYVLGILDAPDRERFRRHLADCPQCTAEAGRLAVVAPLLAELAASPSTVAAVAAGPGEGLSARVVAEVAAVRRRARRRRFALAACAALLVAGGPAATLAITGSDTPTTAQPVAAARQFSATDHATGVSARVGVTPRPWGSQISLDLADVPGPLTCELVAVGAGGERQTVTTWSVPPTGYRTEALHTAGGTGLQASAVDHFEVRTLDGRLLVSVPARA